MYTEYRPSAGLTILEIDIPTGYIISNQTLRDYVKSGIVSNLKQATFLNRKLVFVFIEVTPVHEPPHEKTNNVASEQV